jgi:hypothetical protein
MTDPNALRYQRTAERARQIEALALPDAQEDALTGLSWRCGVETTCTTDARAIGSLMGYGKISGGLVTIRDALLRLEALSLVSAKDAPGGRHTRHYTLRVENWK